MMLSHSSNGTDAASRKRPARLAGTESTFEVGKTPAKRTQVTSSRNELSLPVVEYLTKLFGENSKGKAILEKRTSDSGNIFFDRPSADAIDAYDLDAVKAVRETNLEKLKELRDSGKPLNACNKYGESLLHMACRRGDVAVVKFLVEDANVSVAARDDFGRTPLHDACWTPEPNFPLMDVLIRNCPMDVLLAEDVRGHTPFHYARRDHWSQWLEYFRERTEMLNRRLEAYNVIG